MSASLKSVLRALAFAGLALVLLPSLLYYGAPELPATGKLLMLAGTVVWFGCAFLGFRQNPSTAELDEGHTPVA